MRGLLLRLTFGKGVDCCLGDGADLGVKDLKMGGRCGMVIFLGAVVLFRDFAFGILLNFSIRAVNSTGKGS